MKKLISAFKRLDEFWYLLATALITVFMVTTLSFNVWLLGVLSALAAFGIKTMFNYPMKQQRD